MNKYLIINYFKNLIPTMNKEKFVNMIKFYEIIIKEMFNLNKTKILQYLLDFMIKRKNAQLDLLSYNYETNSSPNFKQKVSSSTFETPDSTQGIRIEGKNNKMNDTSYNFVIRSDPIYLTAGSTFMTNHRDVIKCRSIPCIQTHNFERRPFDNNILKGRRIGRRIMNDTIESEKTQGLSEYNNQLGFPKAENKTQTISISALPTEKIGSIDEKPLKIVNEMTAITKSSEVGCTSPILVESDTPSSSPPIHKIIKPQVIPQRSIQKAFCERDPQTIVKEHKHVFEFKKSNEDSSKLMETTTNFHSSTEQQASSTYLNFREKSHDPLINGQLSLNEIKTLNLNGTEIIPAPMPRNTITTRRKTIDVDHAQPIRSPLELKKVQVLPIQVMKSPSKCNLNFIHNQSQQNKQATSKILKRRQSCHERIFTSKSTNASSNGKNFIELLNGEYESNKMETEIKRLQNLSFEEGKEMQFHQKQQNIQKLTPPLYAQQKRVKFINDEIPAHSQRSPQGAKTQHNPVPQKQQLIENNSPRAIFRQSIQQTLMQPSLKFNQSPIDYQRYQLYFERELRERGFVDRVETLHDKDSKAVPPNRPLELVSHVPPERYLQSSESSQSSVFSSPKLTRTFERSPRIHQRTPVMTNDEKATLVAFNQLQSLHRDPSNLTAQQYSEHLKQVHHLKQIQKSAMISPQGIYQEHQNQLIDERESSCKNTQQSTYQQEDLTPSRLYPLQDGSNDNEQQSLQRKLKLKSKSTKYVEPSQLSKIYHSTPRSTYYTDPYTMTTHKKSSTPTVYSHSQEKSIEQHSQEQLSAFYSLRNESSVNPQIQYQWMLAQAQQQHQHHQNLLNHNQPARPIPRPAIPSPFNDLNLAGIPSNHNIFSHNSLQAFQSQQSDFYRHYFPKNF